MVIDHLPAHTCAAQTRPHLRFMLDLSPPPAPSPEQARELHARWWRALRRVLVFVGLLWLLLIGLALAHIDPASFGLFPGRSGALFGIITAPLVHGGVEHLLANSFGLILLGVLVLYRYPQSAAPAVIAIWLLSGLGTWLIGRPSWHIGASGLTHGLMFFVFVSGLIRRDRTSIAAALLAFAFFGGMLHSIFPQAEDISFEYHLSGAIVGVLMALLLRHRDPAPARRKYSWEIEEEEDREEAARRRDELEIPSPEQVPVLWHRPEPEPSKVLEFPRRRERQDQDAKHPGPQ